MLRSDCSILCLLSITRRRITDSVCRPLLCTLCRARVPSAQLDDEDDVVGLSDVSTFPLIPSFPLPSAQLQPSMLHSLDAAIAAMEEGDERRRKKEERWTVWQRGRLSGGWKEEYSSRRDEEERREGWMLST